MRSLRWVGRPTRVLFSVSLPALAAGCLLAAPHARAQSLPDAPSSLLALPPADPLPAEGLGLLSRQEPGQGARPAAQADSLPPCRTGKPTGSPPAGTPVVAEDQTNKPCQEENPLQPIVASRHLPSLTSPQKGFLAARDVIDPFNQLTIVANAGVIIGANSHSAYGPGLLGFGRLIGYSLVEDMQGEFFGTYVIPSLAHQDPRYYRLPGRPVKRRILNALEHTVVTRHDDGTPMPNYATLLTYPISAELTNLYVPGAAVNAPSTAKRVGLGLASDPVGQLVAEFLPDVAKRIHVRVIFVQEILQNVAGTGPGGAVASQ